MKILIAHNRYKQPGGEDHCVAAEIAMLRAHGHEVMEYCLDNDAIDTMGRLDLASRTIWSRPAARELRDLFRNHRPHVVHFHNTFPLISPAAYFAARRERVPVVQTLHNYRLVCVNALLFRDGKVCEDCLGKAVPWPGIVHKCYRGSRVASTAIATMITVHRALGTWSTAVDAYIALSEFSRKKLIEAGLPRAKIIVKPNFMYPEPGVGAGAGGYAVFVGRLSSEKGIGTLLEAWRALDGTVPLKIAGDGPLANQVKHATVQDATIEWLGTLPPEAIHALIGDATVLLLPSQCYETFGRVIIEAFAKGTPAIVSRAGAMAELVDNGRTGLHFNPGDPHDLAAKVRHLVGEPVKAAAMRLAAREAFDAKFTVEKNYSTLMALYDQTIAAAARRDRQSDRIAGVPAQTMRASGDRP